MLVASSVLAVVLAAAYGWVWNVASLADDWDDRAQAETIAAGVLRSVAADVHAALAVTAPPPGRDPTWSLLLTQDRAEGAQERVLLVWDHARSVLWRNASGTYVADHVTGFGLGYVLTGGRHIAAGEMTASEWEHVGAVLFQIETRVGKATSERSAELTVGPL